MSRIVTVAATQMEVGTDRATAIANATKIVEEAAAKGAQVILLQELFAGPYFCKDQDPKWFAEAEPYADSPILKHFSEVARRLGVVLPVSYFERAANAHFNSLAVIDADGRIGDNYRKTHIPDGPGYQEKYYFSPGDTGFKTWATRFGRIGVAICWDQWFPETARAMALQGAEILFYPTAIGSEPQDPTIDSSRHWQRCMQGHAASNCVPVVASNRIGTERGDSCALTFYGSSFIADSSGAMVQEADRSSRSILTASFDLDAIDAARRAWGLFRDRRPELYTPVLTMDGRTLTGK